MPSINLQDVAKAAGVSGAAASYALSGKPGVSEKTRQHVLKTAERIGYQPDAVLSQLMAHMVSRKKAVTTAVLAFVTDHGGPRAWERNPSVRLPWEGARARAKELGYDLEEFWYGEPGMTPARLRLILRTRGIQGLIFSMARKDFGRLDFDFRGFAAAMSGFCFLEPEITVVVPDHHSNMVLALNHAYARGYRRPLLCLPGGAAGHMEHRAEGAYYYFCTAHAEMEAIPPYISEDYEIAPFCAYVDEVTPDVVISTMGDWGKFLGDRVTDKFGWISLSWTKEETGLAGVDRRLYDQGGFLVDAVVAALHRNETGVPALRKEIMLKGVMVDGPSLPDRNQVKGADLSRRKSKSSSVKLNCSRKRTQKAQRYL